MNFSNSVVPKTFSFKRFDISFLHLFSAYEVFLLLLLVVVLGFFSYILEKYK